MINKSAANCLLKIFLQNFFGILCFISFVPCVALAQAAPPMIVAAANIRPVIEELTQNFELVTKNSVIVIYGSSGNFYQQIVNGGKFDLFFSADEQFVYKLHQQKIIADDGVVYAQGKLVLWLSKHSFPTNISITTFRNALVSSTINKIAIANPLLAPYGKAADQVLQNWDKSLGFRKNIIMGENVGQTAQFALSGSVQAAFIPFSLGLNPELIKNGIVLQIPNDLYDPILQRMTLLSSHPIANLFYKFVRSDQNRKIWEKYGYIVPND